jgi:hypothetical protein
MPGFIYRLAARIRTQGLAESARYGWYRLNDDYQLWRFGIKGIIKETTANLTQQQIGVANKDCHEHHPTPSFFIFRSLMNRIIKPQETDVLLDYGSGLGCAILMAATYRFKRCIGVEYSKELNARAINTVQRARGKLLCQDIQFVAADASLYDVPDDVTVIYAYNPFSGDILRNACNRVTESLARRPRRLRILYYLPGHLDQTINGFKWITKRAEAVFPAISRYRYAFYETV